MLKEIPDSDLLLEVMDRMSADFYRRNYQFLNKLSFNIWVEQQDSDLRKGSSRG